MTPTDRPDPEKFWPALLAILTSGLVYAALPEFLAIGPRWLLILLVCILEMPTVFSRQHGYHLTYRILGYMVSGLITAFMLWSLVLLVINLPSHAESPVQMLRSAGVLWISNVLVFAQWYWRLDAGGPIHRNRRAVHSDGAFLFPQMTLHDERNTWSPRYIDYLFLAFNTSTALSPTDSPVLSRWAKVLVMVQALISLSVIVLLASRAVNIM